MEQVHYFSLNCPLLARGSSVVLHLLHTNLSWFERNDNIIFVNRKKYGKGISQRLLSQSVKGLTSDPIHELSIISLWVGVVVTFWRATKREFYSVFLQIMSNNRLWFFSHLVVKTLFLHCASKTNRATWSSTGKGKSGGSGVWEISAVRAYKFWVWVVCEISDISDVLWEICGSTKSVDIHWNVVGRLR